MNIARSYPLTSRHHFNDLTYTSEHSLDFKQMKSKMSPNIDPAILEALSLDAAKTKISSHGGSGFSSTSKLTSLVDGKEKSFFVKTGKGEESKIMFTGNYAYSAGRSILNSNRRTCVSERNPRYRPFLLSAVLCQWTPL